MELDDFKKRNQGLPSADLKNPKNEEEKIISLFEQFKSFQKKMRRISIFWAAFLVSLAFVYISILWNQPVLARIGMLITGAGFILGAIYTWYRYKPLSFDLYSLNTVEFLLLAEKRLEYITLNDLLIIVPLLLILGTGGGFIFTGRLLHYTDNLILLIIIWVLFFIILCLFGFWAGRKNWEKEYGDIMRRIREAKNNNNLKEDFSEKT